MKRRGFFAALVTLAARPDPPPAPLNIGNPQCPECLRVLWLQHPLQRKNPVQCTGCGWVGELRLG